MLVISECQNGRASRRVKEVGAREAPARQRQNAPVPTGRCFGREAAREEVLRLLVQPACRLVTLTGTPGVGKTRLALALAEQAPDRLHCPLCWVSLADLASPDALADALLAAFELPPSPGEEALAVLRRHVANLDVLLVLDSFEHALPLPNAECGMRNAECGTQSAAAEGSSPTPQSTIRNPQSDGAARQLLTDLLAHAPLLRCLVTSRVPLRIPEEWIYPVPPLAVPPALPMEDAAAGIERCPSVRLFVERARAAEPAWRLTAENSTAVAALCRHLDGLPLAIELAAAQVRAFTVEELLQPWEEATAGRLALLHDPSAGGQDATDHPLRLALESSLARLSAAAQQSLADLSVCAGEFSLEAAQAIVGAEATPVVRELVESNWLHKRERDGRAHYTMLGTIQAFGEEKRAARSGEAERRHAAHFLEVAQRAAALWHTPRQTEARRTFAGDWPNVQRGFRWARARGEDAWVCAYARAVFAFLTHRGWCPERVAWSEAWLAAAERSADARERCRALVACGEALRKVAEVERSQAMLREGLAQARALDEPQCAGEALYSLVEHARRESDVAAARGLLQESIAQFRRAADRAGLARALHRVDENLAPDEATVRAAGQEALRLYRALGSVEGQVMVLEQMGGRCSRRGAMAEGRRLLEEALSLSETAQMGQQAIRLQRLLAGLCQRMGDLEGAERHCRRCLKGAEQVGDMYVVARTQDRLASVLLMRGEIEQARTLLDASYQTFLRLNMPRDYGDVLLSMAECARQIGDVAEAERLLRQSLEVHRARGSGSSRAKSVGVTLWMLGQLYRQAQRYDEAAEVLEESLRHYHRVEVLLELGTTARERGDFPAACRWWMEALRAPVQALVWQLDFARALVEIGRMVATFGDRGSVLLLGVGARELRSAGVLEAAAAARDAEAALKPLGQGARAARRQIARTTLEETLAQALGWLEQNDERRTTNDERRTADTHPSSSSFVVRRSSAAASLRVHLLGRFEVSRHGEPVPPCAWQRPKAAALFQWLCLQGGRRVSREEAMEALWGDLPVDRAAPNLATTLSMLRRALGPLATSCLHSEGETIQLALGDAVWVDAAAFEQHVSAAQRCRRADDADGMARHSRAALALYQGELLPGGPLTEWVLPLRQRLATLRLSALLALAEEALARGDPLEADALAGQALQQDACEESAARVRMQALARQGKRTEALRCFEQLCQALRREFDAEPEAETLRLYHHLRIASG